MFVILTFQCWSAAVTSRVIVSSSNIKMWDRGIFFEILLFLQALNANSFSPVHLFYIIVQSSCVHLSTNTTTPLDTAIIHTTSINIIIHISGFWQPENEISCWYLSSPGPQNSIKSFQHYLTQLAEMPDLEAGRSLDQQVQVHFETYLWIG